MNWKHRELLAKIALNEIIIDGLREKLYRAMVLAHTFKGATSWLSPSQRAGLARAAEELASIRGWC